MSAGADIPGNNKKLTLCVEVRKSLNIVITRAETMGEISHAPQEGMTRPDYFGSMVEIAKQRLKLASSAPSSKLPGLDHFLTGSQLVSWEGVLLVQRIQLNYQHH